MMAKFSKAQIWVETVIYTLIGLTIIGIVLAVATPAIDRYKDEITIEQTISSLNILNEKILETRETVGNIRIVEVRIKEGSLDINGEEDKIAYTLEESRLEYSEPGAEIEQGDIRILTQEKGRKYNIILSLVYENINITYNTEDKKKTLHEASIPYKLSIENLGSSGEKIQIDIEEVS